METQKVKLDIEGMSCSSCVSKVETILRSQEGIQKADVSLLTKEATIEIDATKKSQILKSLGEEKSYRIQEHLDTGDFEEKTQLKLIKQKKRMWLSALLTLPLLAPMLAGYVGLTLHVPILLQWILASVIQFYIALPFYKNAWAALKRRSADMDTLVVLGTSAAYVMSTYFFISGKGTHHNYFETAATIITFILMGRYLEERAKTQTVGAIRDLKKMMPSQAVVLTAKGEKKMDIRFLKIGDTILVKAGERIPLDGAVLDGVSFVDESFLSGESKPVEKMAGAEVKAGALNLDGALKIQVGKEQKESFLAEIISFVENAQSGKADIQRLADKVSAYFVPTVLVISLLTWVVWFLTTGDFQHALWSAVAVLVIACPCALGLATPAALTVGMGEAAKEGFLIRGPESLERIHHTDAIAFDKTGTLTLGKPQLSRVEAFENSAHALGVAQALQKASHHPIALAFLEAKEESISLEASELRNHSGLGVEGKVEGRRYILGSRRFMENQEIAVSEFQTSLQEAQAQGMSFSFLADIDSKKAIAFFSFSDQLRADASKLIESLKERGVASFILSGDAEGAVRGVAEQLKISDYKAEANPLEKVEYLKSLKSRFKSVAMIGDGINDAPALVTADLGISIGSGADIAQSSAKVIILNDNPWSLLSLLKMAQMTYNKIWQNLFFAFIFNIIGIPLAAFGKLTPEFAGLAMGLSSTIVLSNALLLKLQMRSLRIKDR